MAGNTYIQPVAGEPSLGTWHRHVEEIVNFNPADTLNHTVIVANVPNGTTMIAGMALVYDAAGALRWIQIKEMDGTVWAEISTGSLATAQPHWFEVPLDSNKQFMYAVNNADVDLVVVTMKMYSL